MRGQWVEYHSEHWNTLVEMGWTTSTVEAFEQPISGVTKDFAWMVPRD